MHYRGIGMKSYAPLQHCLTYTTQRQMRKNRIRSCFKGLNKEKKIEVRASTHMKERTLAVLSPNYESICRSD